MIGIALSVAFLAVALALVLNLYRLAVGPDIVDRLLAMDTLTINAVALIVLLGLEFGTAVYFEAALILAMFGFVTTVAFCKFLLRGDVIE
jgi:multicomponent K+:H+ antiporter subunit F